MPEIGELDLDFIQRREIEQPQKNRVGALYILLSSLEPLARTAQNIDELRSLPFVGAQYR